MKKIIFASTLLALTLTNCNYLDMDPEQLKSLDKVFTNKDETIKWYNRIFSGDYFPNELWDSQYYNHYMFAVDDACNLLDAHIPSVVHGMINPSRVTAGWDRYWFEVFYQGIRHCNIFLENIGRNTELANEKLGGTDPIMRSDRMIAEARFMRAMYHFWLLRAYGPIAIVDHSIDTEEAAMSRARNSMDECVKWIIDEFDAVMPNLAVTQGSDKWGFPTQGAALAIKSRLLLMDASPMYNGNTVYANWRNNDGKQLISQTYDAEKWKKAAQAAKDIIDLEWYSLQKPASASPTFDDYVNNFMSITTTWNNEIIWARPAGTYWWTMSCLPAVYYSWNARNAATLELANEFFMADGKEARPLEEWFVNKTFSSTNGNGTQANTFDMFVGREPRFYATMFFPQQYVTYASSNYPNIWQTLEFWYSGNCGLSKSSGDRNSTGLGVRKNIPLNATSDQRDNSTSSPNIPFPITRLAEIYLNYCEAMNEYSGATSHATILPFLNEIRTRAGIPSYTGTYTKEQMREMIHQERRIELAWEAHRYFDVRRWFIAHGEDGVFNKPVHGLTVSAGTSATDPAFFTMIETDYRIFRLEQYMLPVEAGEVAFNRDFIQAPFY